MERRVELFAAIRFDWQRYQMPVRALARKYDVHRRTVRQAIASPVPPDRKVPARAAPVRETVAGWIDEMLREDLAAPRKQRHTARRVFERLADEHGAQVSYSYVAKYVARRRAEIAAEDRDGTEGLAGFVPQAREPGAEAEVDFGDVTVELGGQLARCFMFAYRLSYSGKGIHRVFLRTTGMIFRCWDHQAGSGSGSAACGVTDGRGHQAEVGVVEAGQGVPEVYWYAVAKAGRGGGGAARRRNMAAGRRRGR